MDIYMFLTLVVVFIFIIGFSLTSSFIVSSIGEDEDAQCPKCHKYRAIMNKGERLTGVFMKSVFWEDMRNNLLYIRPHGKFIIFYRCKYCRYHWQTTEIKLLR